MQFEVTSNSSEMTASIAEKYAATIKSPTVIALTGDLGAGKTTFSKGFAKGMGIDELVTSPTFTILNEYQGTNLPLYHFDMYRLNSKEEAIESGFEEYFDLRTLKGVCLVEWPQNVEGLLPALNVKINFIKVDENTRKIQFEVRGYVK